MTVIRIVIIGVLLRDVYSSYCTISYNCETTCSVTRIYYSSCGLFGWSRCRRARTVYELCPGTCYRQQCCSGYNGTNCDIPICDGSTTCPNGGTCVSPDNCECLPGFSAPFCTEDCGQPREITDGTVSVTSTILGGIATYTCNQDYGMATGDRVRTCQSDFAWSGQEPSCIFANYCESSPCLNGATCVNLIGSIRCECAQGWEGEFCENDTEPPMVTGCSNDTYINATEKTVLYSWSDPVFSDNRGSQIEIVSNYPTPEFTFPWGDFKVQYVATKTSNGLQTECTFQIIVRPTPCEPLNVPKSGALLCNGWQKDYGKYCMIMCRQNFTIGPSYSFLTRYVCGASGNWMATRPVPDCEVPVDSESEALYYHQEYTSYVYTHPSCENDVTKSRMQSIYLENLNGTAGFSSFCSTYGDECVKEMVDVKC